METKYAIKIKFYLRIDVTCCTNSSFLEYEIIFFSHCTSWQLETRDKLLKLFFFLHSVLLVVYATLDGRGLELPAVIGSENTLDRLPVCHQLVILIHTCSQVRITS